MASSLDKQLREQQRLEVGSLLAKAQGCLEQAKAADRIPVKSIFIRQGLAFLRLGKEGMEKYGLQEVEFMTRMLWITNRFGELVSE